jgi:hypothetical protein
MNKMRYGIGNKHSRKETRNVIVPVHDFKLIMLFYNRHIIANFVSCIYE